MTKTITDWRQSSIFQVKDSSIVGDIYIPEGAFATKIVEEKYGNNKNFLSFPHPSFIAMFLNRSFISQTDAEELATDLLAKKVCNKIDKKYIHQFPPEYTVELFNYFEYIFSAIVFAWMTLESFANIRLAEALPDNYMYNLSAKATIYNKQDIEFKLDLDTKFSILAKEVYNIKFNKNTRTRSSLKKLKDYRNAITHLKYSYQRSSGADNQTIYGSLLPRITLKSKKSKKTSIPIQPFNIAVDILNFFYRANLPPWLKNCPHLDVYPNS